MKPWKKDADCIYRQEALASIKALFPDMPKLEFLGNRERWRERYDQYLNAGEAIRQVPSADVAPVVRCKDCKWFNKIGCAIKIVDESDKPHEDDFCSFAERKDGEKNEEAQDEKN